MTTRKLWNNFAGFRNMPRTTAGLKKGSRLFAENWPRWRRSGWPLNPPRVAATSSRPGRRSRPGAVLFPKTRPTSSQLARKSPRVFRGLSRSRPKPERSEADDPAGARVLFEKALAISADLEDAREGLQRSPPEPPTGLVAEFTIDRVLLRWNPPPFDKLGPTRFRVLRKRQGIPTQPNDGTTVVELADAEAEDRGVKPGESVGYAVYAVRGDVFSRSATTAGPIEVLPEVIGLRVACRSGEVALSWTLARPRLGHPGGPESVEKAA